MVEAGEEPIDLKPSDGEIKLDLLKYNFFDAGTDDLPDLRL